LVHFDSDFSTPVTAKERRQVKAKDAPAATPADAARAAAIRRRDAAQAAYDEKKEAVAKRRADADRAVEESEYGRLLREQREAEASHVNFQRHGVGNGALVGAEEAVRALTPPDLAAAIEATKLEWDETDKTLGRTYGPNLNGPMMPGTVGPLSRPGSREGLERRLAELKQGQKELERIAAHEIDYRPAMSAVLDQLRLLVRPGERPIYRPTPVRG
jgi:hypothetical protein